MLGLEWSTHGPGAALELFCAQSFDKDLPDLPCPPRPLRGKMEFSYACLHSYVERYIAAKDGVENLDLPTQLALARNFQSAAVTQLEEKLLLGIDWCFRHKIEIHDVVVSGGVASNLYLRER